MNNIDLIPYLYILLIMVNLYLAIASFLKVRKEQKNISKQKKEEANRYFRGSPIENNNNYYKSRVHTVGLRAEKINNKIVFTKTAKIADTGILY